MVNIQSLPQIKYNSLPLQGVKWWMLLKEIIAVYSENHMKSIKYTLWAKHGIDV
jgi:hypothetical protein